MSDRRSWNVLLSHPAVRYPDVKCQHMKFRMWNFCSRNSSPGGLSYAAQRGPSACARCRDPSPEWHGVRKAIRINSIWISQEDTRCAPLSGFPQVEAHNTREHHTSDDSISYLDMLSGSLTKVSKLCYFIPKACYSPCSAALRWCVRICLWQRTSKLWFFMFLSFSLLFHGFPRTLLNLELLWWSNY